MPKKMSPEIDMPLVIQPFQWHDWHGLWQLRKHQLAEQGITIDTLPTEPDVTAPYEQDYHRIDQVYLTSRGNFWIAWRDGLPVGHIGAEDKGAYIELRRMYVRADYRRHGIGTRLLRALMNHCITHNVGSIELWTAAQGPGRLLYEQHGFRTVEMSGGGGDGATDNKHEVRMRLAFPRGNIETWRYDMKHQLFADYLQRLEGLQHKLHQDVQDLPAQAMDWSPGPAMNSVAVLLAHIAGVLREGIDLALDEPPSRVRAQEFQTRGVLSAEMLRRLDAVIDYARGALPRLGLEDLDKEREDEDGTITCGWALLHALEHAYLHLGHLQVTCQIWRQREK